MPALCIEREFSPAMQDSPTITCVNAPIFKRMKVLKKFKKKIGLAGRASDSSNLPPLKFHSVCGENMRVQADGRIARRNESFCKGIVFSNRPVKVGERVYIRLLEISTNWSGVVRFGFTSQDPNGLRDALPKYACPDLTNKPGYWAKALSERFAEEGIVLFYYVTSTGDVHFGINGEERGVFFGGVDTRSRLWVLMDVYGNSTAVEFLDPLAQMNNRVRIVNDLSSASTNPVSRVIHQAQPQIPAQQPPQQPVATQQQRPHTPPQHNQNYQNHPQQMPPQREVERLQPSLAQLALTQNRAPDVLPLRHFAQHSFTPLPFHRVKGRNIKFNNERTVVTRVETEYSHGYVFTGRPLRPGERLVIQVLGTEVMYAGALAFGLTSSNPAGLEPADLPEDCDLLLDRPEYWVVSKDVAASPQPGDELAFTLSPRGEVSFSRNGSSPRVFMHVDHTLQLWAFLDVYGNTSKVRSLGVTKDNSPSSHHAPGSASPPRVSETGRPSSQTRVIAPLVVSLPPSPPPNNPSPRVSPHPPNTREVSNVNTMNSSVYSAAYMEPISTSSPGDDPSNVNATFHECIICYEKSVDSVLYMCGHMCMCYECAIQQWRGRGGGHCPICRAQIRDVIRPYRS